MLHTMESGQMAKLACEGLVVPCLITLRAVVVVGGVCAFPQHEGRLAARLSAIRCEWMVCSTCAW